MNRIKIDLEELIMALESQADFGEFFLDRESGEIILVSDYTDDDADTQRQRLNEQPNRFLYIRPLASHAGWEIMQDFVQSVANSDAKNSLERALQGRKPFRSFKDQLLDFPDIRDKWFAYHTQRMNAIARDWLEENDISFAEKKTAVSKSLQEMTAEDDAAGLTFRE